MKEFQLNQNSKKDFTPKLKLIFFFCCLVIISCSKDKDIPIIESLFPNSIVSTEIDFIQTTDPDEFLNVTYTGQEDKEMPDKRNDELFDVNTYVFKANFTNNKVVEIWVHSSFGSEVNAREYVDKLTPRLGKLPEVMRAPLSHVVIHKGNEGAFAEANANFFVLYSDNMDERISNNDLEETVFHESVHASLDAIHLKNGDWLRAQESDNAFITEYAQELPNKEDLAESAIFIYTMEKYPNRLSNDIENWIRVNLPSRLAYINSIFQ